jgi:hypothetical protein
MTGSKLSDTIPNNFGHSFSLIFAFDIHFPSHFVIFTTVIVYKSNLSSNKMYYRTIPNDT